MVIAEHLHIMSKGTVAWNTWRRLHPTLQPDLSFATLSDQDLSKMDLSGVNLVGATLYEVNLSGQDLSNMDLGGANLCGADLSRAILVGTNLANTTLKDCTIYGVSVWDVRLNGAEQINLTITPKDQPTITVDNLKIAQFIYLLLDNKEIRDAIDTIAKKAVLILGHFGKRKPVLDVLRDELRKQNYLPILFDFENPKSRDVTETVRTLAHLARFILADLTDPSSIPLELDTIAPILEVPIQPLLLDTITPLLQVLIWPIIIVFLWRAFKIYFEDLRNHKNVSEIGFGVGPTGLNVNFKKQDSLATSLVQDSVVKQVKEGVTNPTLSSAQKDAIVDVVSMATHPATAQRIAGAKVLWVDDHPDNNLYPRKASEVPQV